MQAGRRGNGVGAAKPAKLRGPEAAAVGDDAR